MYENFGVQNILDLQYITVAKITFMMSPDIAIETASDFAFCGLDSKEI